MLDSLQKILKLHISKSFLLISIILLVVVFLSYGKTINMFYWIDDWGLLFNMIHTDIFPGNFGNPNYRYITSPFAFLYPLFGLNAQAYFALAFIQYYLLSVIVFLFVRTFTKSMRMGLCAALLFSSGYIGSYAMYRISNSYQLIGTTAFMVFTIWSLFLYFKSKKIKYYVLSLLFFAATLEFFFLRAHSLLPIVLATSVLLGNFKFNKKSLMPFVRLHLPFFLLYYFYFFLDTRITPGGSNSSKDAMQNMLKIILHDRHFELLNNFLISATNVIIPQTITREIYTYLNKQILFMETNPQLMTISPVVTISLAILVYWVGTRKNLLPSLLSIFALGAMSVFILWSSSIRNPLWNPNKLELFTASIGASFILFLLWIYFSFRSKERLVTTLLPLGIIWVFATVLGYYIYSPNTSLDSISRYLIPGFVGTVLIYTSFFYLLPKLMLPNLTPQLPMYILTFLLVLNLVSHARQEQSQIISTVSEPSRMGFQALQQYLSSKNIPQDSIFYLETIDDVVLRGNILGGMPHISVAIAAGFNDGATIADSYEHLFYLIESGKVKLENVYTFFASHGWFINTSDELKDLLVRKNRPSVLKNWQIANKLVVNTSFAASTTTIALKDGMAGLNPVVEVVDINYPNLTPIEVVIKMKTEPLSSTTIRFPYYDYTTRGYTATEFEALKDTQRDTAQHFSETDVTNTLIAQKEKQNFHKNATVTTTTVGKHTDALNLIDGNLDSNWSAYDANWNNSERPQEIVLDLGYATKIQKLFWVNHYAPATPTRYTIYYSDNSINWTEAVKIEKGQRIEGHQVVSEDIGVIARYIRFSIYDTYSGLGHPPAIDEIWVTSNESVVDIETQSKILQCIYCFIGSPEQARTVNSLLNGIAKARISWTTDARDVYHADYSIDFPINLDSNEHIYTIYIPAKGTRLKKIKIDNFPLPLNVNIKEITIKSLTLEELVKKGLIKNFGKE